MQRCILIFVICFTAFLCINNAHAGLLSFLGKATKSTSSDGKVADGAGFRKLSKHEATTLASGLGAGVIYVEAGGGKLLYEILTAGTESLAGTSDDLLQLTAKAKKLTGSHDTPKFALTQETAVQLGDKLEDLSSSGQVFIVDPVVGSTRVVSKKTKNGTIFYRELQPGVVTTIDSHITKDVAHALSDPAKLEELVVVSMYAKSDVDALRALATAAGDRLIDAEVIRKAIVTGDTPRQLRGKTIIVVGHIEKESFVARHADGSISHAVDISALESMASGVKSNIIGAGCSSFCAGNNMGFATSITDLDVAEGVKLALNAKTLGGMIGAFGQKTPLVVSGKSLSDFAETRRLDLVESRKHSGIISSGTLAVRLFSTLRKPLINKDLLAALGVWYIVGVVSMLLMIRTNRRAFIRSFPKLPSPVLPNERPGYVGLLFVRELAFLAIAPVFTAVTVITFFFGGWSYRQNILSFFWNYVKHPLSTSITTIRVLAYLILGLPILLVIYAVPMWVLIAPGIFLTGFAFDNSENTVISWVIMSIGIIYWFVAIWIGFKLHRMLWKWLDE